MSAVCALHCSYGFLDVLFHHIADTHVAHHLFSQMPHYHAQVTAAWRAPCPVSMTGPPHVRPAASHAECTTRHVPACAAPQALPSRPTVTLPAHIASTLFTHPVLPFLLPLLPPCPLCTQEATEALKPILGDYYSRDGRNVLQALWQEITTCHYVAPERDGSGVLWFATHTKSDVVSATAAAAAGFNADKAAKAA